MATRSFDDLVEAITGAVIHARELLEAQHLDTINRYFKDSNGDGKLEALTQTVQIPNAHTDKKDDFLEVEIPIFSLVPLNSLKLKEVEIEFDAYLSSLEEDDMPSAALKSLTEDKKTVTKRKQMHMEMSGNGYLGSKKNNAKIRITMQGTEPPEGLIRINNHVLKQIP